MITTVDVGGELKDKVVYDTRELYETAQLVNEILFSDERLKDRVQKLSHKMVFEPGEIPVLVETITLIPNKTALCFTDWEEHNAEN